MQKYYRKRLPFKYQDYIAIIIPNTLWPENESIETCCFDAYDYNKIYGIVNHPNLLFFRQTPYYVRPALQDPGFKRLGNGLPPLNEIIWIKASETAQILFMACFIHQGTDIGLYPVEFDHCSGYANVRIHEKYFTGDRTGYYWILLKNK